MTTVAQIVDAFGGPAEFGRVCGWTANPAARGSDIKRRGSIPHRYWPSIVGAARERGLAISTDSLMQAHAAPQSGEAA